MDIREGFFSLSQNLNKVLGDTEKKDDGAVSSPISELDLSIDDSSLVKLADKWEQDYKSYNDEITKLQEESESYWRGRHYDSSLYLNGKRPLVDNLIFEALETILPEITRKNPEAFVFSDDTPEGNALSQDVTTFLAFHSDRLALKLKLKQVTRHWAMYLLGVMKHGWDAQVNDITSYVIRPQKLILSKDGTISEKGEYSGQYIGEKKELTASKLKELFPKHAEYILKVAGGLDGTLIKYTEWWATASEGEIVFWKLGDVILGKSKTPHWNYTAQETRTDEFGVETVEEVKGVNHFSHPQKPYTFLSVFNLGKQPHDETSLIQQNLPLQDLINKREAQIDKNVSDMNGGLVLSGQHFTKEQAAEAVEALRAGGAIIVPNGKVGDSYQKHQGTPLPGDVFVQLQDSRNELRNIFGSRGSTPAGISNETTVRGKILSRELDSSRNGGGITEFLEQFADSTYNWWVQLMAVYYDEEHYASIIGRNKAQQFAQLKGSDLNRKLTVSVKEGSLIPQDPLTKRNEAIDLWNASALDPIELYTRLDFPNPQEAARNLLLWKMIEQGVLPPNMLFPDFPPIQAPMMAGGGAQAPAIPGNTAVAPGSSLSAIPI